MKTKYCECIGHYVCYMGPICMNKGCGRPHGYVKTLPKKERLSILKNPTKYMTKYKDGTPAWHKTHRNLPHRKWYQFWKEKV